MKDDLEILRDKMPKDSLGARDAQGWTLRLPFSAKRFELCRSLEMPYFEKMLVYKARTCSVKLAIANEVEATSYISLFI